MKQRRFLHQITAVGAGQRAPVDEMQWSSRNDEDLALPGNRGGDGVPDQTPNGRAELISSHGTIREVVSFYRVGDIVTGSAAKSKLETVRVRLLGGPQRAVAILVSAEATAKGGNPRPSIDAFVAVGRELGVVN